MGEGKYWVLVKHRHEYVLANTKPLLTREAAVVFAATYPAESEAQILRVDTTNHELRMVLRRS